MPRLTEAEYRATMGTPMTLVEGEDEVRPVPLKDYFEAISDSDLEGHDFSDRNIEKVYREPRGHFVHVLIASRTPNVFLVIIVDEPNQTIHGHHLLDLNRLYGVE